MKKELLAGDLAQLAILAQLEPRAVFYISNGRLCAGLVSAPAQPPACPLAALDIENI